MEKCANEVLSQMEINTEKILKRRAIKTDGDRSYLFEGFDTGQELFAHQRVETSSIIQSCVSFLDQPKNGVARKYTPFDVSVSMNDTEEHR